jgi:hypothetical protein
VISYFQELLCLIKRVYLMINQIESEVTVEYIVDLLKEHMKEFDYVWSEFEKVNYK